MTNITQEPDTIVADAPEDLANQIPPAPEEPIDPEVPAPANEIPEPQPAFVPVLYDGLLPAPIGAVARSMDATPKENQRSKAEELHAFLLDPEADLRMLNNEEDNYTALISVPGTHKVKLVYGLGLGTSRIGQVSPIAHKLLTLSGEGGPLLGTPTVMTFNQSIKTVQQVVNPDNEVVDQLLQAGPHDLNKHVARATAVATTQEIMKIAPIPTYLVYDGFENDLDAVIVYERLRACQHPSDMLDHAIAFLRSCLIGKWRLHDNTPSTSPAEFTTMPHQEARRWATSRCRALFPAIMAPHPLPPPPALGAPPLPPAGAPPVLVQHGAGGAGAPVFNMDATALREFFALATQGQHAEEKKDDAAGELKVSELEKQHMRTMCGLPVGSEAFPGWFKALHGKHLDDKDKINIIAETLQHTSNYEDAEVPLYPTLLKTIKARDWTAADMGFTPSYLNAAKGLSPFAMIDFTLEDIAVMTNTDTDLNLATQIAPADLRAARSKVKAGVPASGDDLLLMLKRFANLIYALFTSQSPLYQELHLIIKALKAFSLNARKNLPHKVRATIMWIILLQARKFSKGQMDMDDAEDKCLGEFKNLKHHLLAKSCAGLNHEDMPDELRKDPSQGPTPPGKRDLEAMLKALQSGKVPAQLPPKKTKNDHLIREPHNAEVSTLLRKPMQEAGGISLDDVCTFCGVTRAALIPNFDITKDCAVHFLFGTCRYGDSCIFNHRTATKAQLKTIQDKLDKFIRDPKAAKSTGKKK